MTLTEFKYAIEQAEELTTVDDYCWQWLNQAAKESGGASGELAIKLMDICRDDLMGF